MEFVLHLAEFALIIHLLVKGLGRGGAGGGAWRGGIRKHQQACSGRFNNANNPPKGREQRRCGVQPAQPGVTPVFLPSGKQFSGSMASSAISEYSSSSSPGFLRSTVLPSDRLTSSFCWLDQETAGHKWKQLTSLSETAPETRET